MTLSYLEETRNRADLIEVFKMVKKTLWNTNEIYVKIVHHKAPQRSWIEVDLTQE